jgi:hypothetical protein
MRVTSTKPDVPLLAAIAVKNGMLLSSKSIGAANAWIELLLSSCK